MKYRLPNVTWLRAVCTALAVGMSLATSDSTRGQESDAPALNGQALVARAASQIRQHRSLEAKIRQRVALFDQYLVGTGTYLQLHDHDGLRFRLELRLQLDDRLTSLQQLHDGRYVWTRRDLGGSQSLGRIDVQRVEQALKQARQPARPAEMAWFTIGGLGQLLQGLSDNFAFAVPTADEISNVPVWRVQGTWKAEVLERLVSQHADASNGREAKRLPPHLPDRVSLVLGRDTKVLPLFPYRVEFSRSDPDTATVSPLLAMELFEVRFRPELDPRLFTFQLGEQRVEDETQAYLDKIGLLDGSE